MPILTTTDFLLLQPSLINEGKVLVKTLSVEEKSTFYQELLKADTIEIVSDYFPFLTVKNNLPLVSFHTNHDNSKQLKDVTYINKPNKLLKYFPAIFRNHIKLFKYGNKVFIGGINLGEDSNRSIDFMIQVPDAVATYLSGNITNYWYGKDLNNCQRRIVIEDSVLLLDRPRIFENSAIMKEACKIVSEAKSEVYLTSQFLPSGSLLKAIINASNSGVKVNILLPPEDYYLLTKFPYNINYFISKRKLKGLKNVTIKHSTQIVHGKVIVTDSNLLIGSHNYLGLTNIFGIVELNLAIKNKVIVDDARNKISKYFQNE